MENIRPLILITNDDSINAPGIHQLADCVRSLGDVYVVAPENPHSGQSAALTVGGPLRITELPSQTDGVRLFTVNGTPVDCVKLALHAIVPRIPDAVFSGINHGSNSGINVTYSGTMGAVLEACMQGIPAVGFSLLHHSLKADFSLSTAFVATIAAQVLAKGLPKGVCLNVNIPAKVIPEGIKVCRATTGHWTDEYKRYLDPMGVPFYWLTGHFVNEEPNAEDTDEYWLKCRYISVVPVSTDQTAKDAIKDLAERFDS
ncbi:5'/3'-nucleotidase SurE [uncultured Duncaniella sp.]|uniref:5'/3'-nucleotidase SurE n=1 Tax=uncultured Duncaniella sp. TaxID=2768039 RepID=UPI0032205669